MTRPEDDPVCWRHGTPLHIDAIRGLVCAACDAETTAWGFALPGRVWRAIQRRCRAWRG
jgi:hypothetical protein